MAVQTENQIRERRDGDVQILEVTAAATIFQGSLVQVASEKALVLTKAASLVLAGVAETHVATASSDSDDPDYVTIRSRGVFAFVFGGTVPAYGVDVYGLDDNTVSSVSAAATKVGRSLGAVKDDSTKIWVELEL